MSAPSVSVSPDPQKPVQSPLTLVMTLESPQAAQELGTYLASLPPGDSNPINQAMNSIGTVHFARFTFLDNNTKFAVITDYDGPFDIYLRDFAYKIGGIFDKLFSYMADAPPAPVKDHLTEFMTYVRDNDAGSVAFYSAYPNLTVLDILNNEPPQ